MNALMKNGITPEDLSRSFKDGYDEGFRDAAPAITKTVYAAVILAARKQLGFGRKHCQRGFADIMDRRQDSGPPAQKDHRVGGTKIAAAPCPKIRLTHSGQIPGHIGAANQITQHR